MSGKRRVYEVARDLGLENKALVTLLQDLGVGDVRNHMSAISPEAEDRLKRHLDKKDAPSNMVEERIRPTVVKRRAAVVRRRKTDDGTEEVSSSEVATAEAGDAAQQSTPEETYVPPAPQRAAAPEVQETPPAAAPPPVQPPEPITPTAAPEPVRAEASQPAEEAEAPRQPSVEREAEKPVPVETTQEPVSVTSERAPAVAPTTEAKPESAPAPEARPAIAPPARPTPAPAPAAQPTAAHAAPAPRPSTPPAAGTTTTRPSAPPPAGSPSQAPKRGIDVWEGRPGVPMHHHRPGPRRVQYDAKAPGAAGPGGPGQRRGPGGRPMPGGARGTARHRGIGSFAKGKGAGAPVTKERSAHKKVVRIEESVLLQGLAGSMGVKATDVLRKLLQLGMTGININSTLDADTAKIVASEFGWDVEDVAVSEEAQIQAAQGIEVSSEPDEALEPRPPVVSVMGHVDHGKTSLLDALRKSNVAAGEAGGITQHIGAYSVSTPRGLITFLDTPGHEAFTAMRARGAQATDITILVVAADDGVMPQTKEAINHARAAKVPIVVAINKCDKPEAQPERVRRELSELGLVPEEWGGDTLISEVSAHTKQGLDDLLERVLLQAELLNLRANPDKPASGIVVEAQLDRGKGPVATVLVTEGTLRPGDVVLAGAGYGKVRAMHDSQGRQLKQAGPAMPAALIGLSEVPRAGDQLYVVKDMKTAQELAESRKTKERRSLAPSAGNKPRSLEEIAKLMSEQEQLELKVIIKADVQGSAEAVSDSLQRLTTEKVRVSVVHSAAGAITENDVNLAVAAGAIIIGFNVRPAGKATALAQQEQIQIRQYSIIYNVVDDVKLAMEGLLAPKLVEKDIGKAEVRQTFRVSKAGTIAGCMVIDGLIRRGCSVRLQREGELVWEGKLSSLKRFKDDAREVKEGFECGLSLEGFNDIKVGDIIEAYEIEEIKQKL
jgi:translation initiation factor IF-2